VDRPSGLPQKKLLPQKSPGQGFSLLTCIHVRGIKRELWRDAFQPILLEPKLFHSHQGEPYDEDEVVASVSSFVARSVRMRPDCRFTWLGSAIAPRERFRESGPTTRTTPELVTQQLRPRQQPPSHPPSPEMDTACEGLKSVYPFMDAHTHARDNPIIRTAVVHATVLNSLVFTYPPISSFLLIRSSMKISTKGSTTPFKT